MNTIVTDSLESKIEQDLVAYNVTDAVLSSLKEKFSGLKLKSLDDKESYLEIKEAARECSKVRNLIVKCCKAGREDAVKIQKLWVAKEKEVVAKVTEVEAPLDAEISRFQAEVERLANAEKLRQEEAYMQRTQALTKMSALYSDGCFVLGDFSIEGNLVKESSEDVWKEEILPRFTEEYQKAEADRIEETRKKAEHEAEIKRQQDDLLKQKREFEEQQAEFKKQQDTIAEEERKKIQSEEREKEKQRNELQNKRLTELLPFNPTGSGVNMATLWNMAESDFAVLLVEKKNEFKKAQEENKRAIEEQAAQRERDRIAEEQRVMELKRQQEEQLKAEELNKSADKVKFADLISHFEIIKVPGMRSGQYRKKVAIIREKLEEILALKN